MDGKLKNYYSDMLISYNVVWRNVMREIFGEDVNFLNQ